MTEIGWVFSIDCLPSLSTRLQAMVALRADQHSAVKAGPEALLGGADWPVITYRTRRSQIKQFDAAQQAVGMCEA